MKLPSFQFYPGDWTKDPALRLASKSAKGFWMDVLCLMFECEERGVLIAGDRPWSDEEVAGAVEGDTNANLLLLHELLRLGIAKRDKRGAIFSARMVRDEEARQSNALRQRKFRCSCRNGDSNASSNGRSNKKITPLSEDEEKLTLTLYEKFPKHVGRGAALKAIRRAQEKVEFEVLLVAVEKFAASCRGKDPQFIPHPATWFNQERWLDEAPKAPGPAPVTPHLDKKPTEWKPW